MSSGVSGTPQHAFLSTHNALRMGNDEDDDKLTILVSELQGGKKVRGSRSCSLSVFPFYDVEMIKRLIIKRLDLPPSTNVCEIRVFYRGNEIPNHRSLLACTTDRERGRIRLQWAFRDAHSATVVGVRELGIRPPPTLEGTICEINLALQRGMHPRLTMDGTGGTYIMTNTKKQNIAIFKPSDEEAFAPNNPRKYEGKMGQKGFRSGVLSGEGAQREVAAFLLDAQYGGMTGIPQTTKVEAIHPKFFYRHKGSLKWKDGSLQEFIEAHECCGDFDAKAFSIFDAHKIGIFDLRILNLDRNDGNLLVVPTSRNYNITQKITEEDLTPEGKLSKYQLIPIDHGLILPDTMDLGDIDLVWYTWPQSKIEFSENELRHILSLEPDKDAVRLARKLEIREECLRTMRVSTRVLQIGGCMHLNLFQIATLVLRFDDFEVPSIMERAVRTALMQAWTAINATSLIQQNRLPGSVMIDLQMGERKQQIHQTEKNTETGTHGTANLQTTDDQSIGKHSLKNLFLSGKELLSSYSLPRLISSNDSVESSDSSSNSWSSSSPSDSDDVPSLDSSPSEFKVSRISGVPLVDATPGLRPRRKGGSKKSKPIESVKKHKDEYTMKTSPIHEAQTDRDISHISTDENKLTKGLTTDRQLSKSKKHTAFNTVGDLPLQRTTTATRKRTTALSSRRGTGSRMTPANVNSTWVIIDRNKKPIPLDWENPLFEKTFFECFELLIRRHIIETHPEWQSYPFHGDQLLKDIQMYSSPHRQRKRSGKRVDDSGL